MSENIMIGILDLKLGNLRSVANSVYTVGFDSVLITEAQQLDSVSHLIIPGVGYFPAAMHYLQQTNLIDAVMRFNDSGRPLLGICLGMQLLATVSYEGVETQGLNLIPGSIQRFAVDAALRVPHVGWNEVNFLKTHPVFEQIKNDRDFYFVHSYHYSNLASEDVYGATEYGGKVPAIVARKNVLGFQFHPEKSQKNGLTLLENFCRWDGQC